METGLPPGATKGTKLLLTPEAAADALSISRALLYRLIMHKRIRSVKVGGARRIPLKSLQEYVDTLCESGGEGR